MHYITFSFWTTIYFKFLGSVSPGFYVIFWTFYFPCARSYCVITALRMAWSSSLGIILGIWVHNVNIVTSHLLNFQRLQEVREGMHFVVTATTRAKRSGEADGKDYYFVTKEEFLSMIERNDLLEYALVYGDYKGIPKQQVYPCVVLSFFFTQKKMVTYLWYEKYKKHFIRMINILNLILLAIN